MFYLYVRFVLCGNYTMSKEEYSAQSTQILPYYKPRGDYEIVIVHLFATQTKVFSVLNRSLHTIFTVFYNHREITNSKSILKKTNVLQ